MSDTSKIHAIDMPKWGMTMEEGVIDEWLIAEGDSFAEGDLVCTIESTKVSNDLEAPFAGTLRRIVARSGQTLPVGAMLAVSADPDVPDEEIDAFIAANSPAPAAGAPAVPAAAPAPAPGVTPVPAVAPVASSPAPAAPTVAAPVAPRNPLVVPAALQGGDSDEVFATSHAHRFAAEHRVALDRVTGTGRGGRISVTDIEAAIVAAGGSVPGSAAAQRDPGPRRSTADDSRVSATPIARRLATELGLNLNDARSTGSRGRVSREDVLDAARRLGLVDAPGTGPSAPSCATDAATCSATSPEYVDLPMSSMRRVIGSRLQASKQTAPHFRVHQDVRLDALLALRAQVNSTVPGVKVSVNDLILKAAATALVRVPDVNVQFDEATQTIRRFADADISVAVALPDGLITPIVRGANRLPLGQLSSEVKSLVTRAKSGTLRPEEFQGGTFSVSNLGMLGVTAFDAIINPPQAAILAVGAGRKVPVVGADGLVEVGTIVTLSLSSDHRIIDGALAATFMGELRGIIETPAQMLV